MDIVCKPHPPHKTWSMCSAPRFSGFPQCDLEMEGQIWRVGFLFPFHWDAGSLVLSAKPGHLTLNFLLILLCLPSHCRSPGIRSERHYISFYMGSQNWIHVSRLSWQLFSPAEPSPWVQHILFMKTITPVLHWGRLKTKPLQFYFNYIGKVTVPLKPVMTFSIISCCILAFQLNKVIKIGKNNL